ncbi:MAG: HAD family hydrolase [Acidobacteriia bacterium]|nr:HAD family hydrolase [Terriglobia bacterium]
MHTSEIRAVFFDAGNTLVFPRLEDLARDLTAQGYPATVEDFYAAERAGKQRLDEWLWPQIRKGQVPRTVDPYYWAEYLRALMARVQVPEAEQPRLIERVAGGFRDITCWSRVPPATPPFLAALRAQGYTLGVISNSIGTMEEQITRVGLREYFQTVLDSARVGVEKPHPEIFEMTLRLTGVAASEAVFVGDTNATDMGGAQLAGLHGVLMDHCDAYPHVDGLRIKTLPELEKILLTL